MPPRRAGLVAKQVTVHKGTGGHVQTYWIRPPEEHKAVVQQQIADARARHAQRVAEHPAKLAAAQERLAAHPAKVAAARAAGRPEPKEPKLPDAPGEFRYAGGTGTQFTPAMHEHLKAIGADGKSYPPAYVHPDDIRINLDGNIHRHAIVTYRDSSGNLQSGYTQQYHDWKAKQKWALIKRIRPQMEAATRSMQEAAERGSDAHAVGLLIAHTGIRVGSEQMLKGKNRKKEERYGATTLERRHVTANNDGSVSIRFIGKAGHENIYHVTDPALAATIRRRLVGKGPNDRVFNTSDSQVRTAVPAGFRPKDFRTVMGTATAERALNSHHPPPPLTGDARTDMRSTLHAVRAADVAASTALNNAPSMAHKSYIHPEVFTAWANRIGLPHEWLEPPPRNAQAEE